MRGFGVVLGVALAAGAAHADDIDLVLFGSGSDQTRPYTIFQTMAEQDPDLVLLLGDNVDAEVTDAAAADLAAAYGTLAASPEFAALRAEAPVVAAWDDNDYGASDGGAEFPFKAESKALFVAAFPPVDPAMADREGTYQAAVFGEEGRRVQVIVLDTRSFRSPLLPTDEPDAPGKQRYMPDPDPAKTMLGEAQWAWLEEQLRQPAELRILMSSVQLLAENHGFERWGNLPLERDRLIGLIDETGAQGLIVLSGDRRIGALYRRATDVPYPFYEITSSGLNNAWGQPMSEAGPSSLATPYVSDNFGAVMIDWDRGVVSLELCDTDGRRVRAVAFALDELQPQ